jgi:hypothetical protein
MPRIPYNPSRIVSAPQQQPGVRVPVEAAGAAAMGNAHLAQTGQQLIATTADMQRDRRERDTRADFAAFRTQLAELQAQRDIELSNIPVQDGIDFEAKASAIQQKYAAKAADWVHASGNVRHRGARELFEQELKQADSEARIDLMQRADRYERQRSITRHEREIELGIQQGDERLIKNGVQGLLSNGKITGAQAEGLSEKYVLAMNKAQDDQRIKSAENALHAGDFEGFDEQIAALALPTGEERKNIRNKMLGSHAYHSAQGNLREIEDLTGLTSFIEDPEAFAAVKGMSAGTRQQLVNEAQAKRRQIERAQVSNARRFMRDAQAGRLDFNEFNSAREADDANGLSSITAGEIESAMRAAQMENQDRERFQNVDRQNPAYQALLDELTENAIDGRTINKKRKATYKDFRDRIEGLNVGETARANLWDRYLLMREADLREGREDFSIPILQPGRLGDTRKLSETEQTMRIDAATFLREAISLYGAPGNIGTFVEEVDEEIRQFFRRNANPNSQQLDEKDETIRERMIEGAIRNRLRMGN